MDPDRQRYGNNVADTGIRRVCALQEAIDLLLSADTPPIDRHRERGKETHIRILRLVNILGDQNVYADVGFVVG